jgi:hypothetical protein
MFKAKPTASRTTRINGHKITHNPCISTTINNYTQRHGGNRGLNTEQDNEGIEIRCEEKQKKV